MLLFNLKSLFSKLYLYSSKKSIIKLFSKRYYCNTIFRFSHFIWMFLFNTIIWNSWLFSWFFFRMYELFTADVRNSPVQCQCWTSGILLQLTSYALSEESQKRESKTAQRKDELLYRVQLNTQFKSQPCYICFKAKYSLKINTIWCT